MKRGELVAGHRTERRCDGRVERARCAHRLAERAEDGTEGADRIGQVRFRRLPAGEGGGEAGRAGEEVLEHVAHRELPARRGQVEVGGVDAADDRTEDGTEGGELGDGVHGGSFG